MIADGREGGIAKGPEDTVGVVGIPQLDCGDGPGSYNHAINPSLRVCATVFMSDVPQLN